MRNLKFILYSLLFFLIASCNCINGSYDLGNNFTLLEGDKLEDRVVVYCVENKRDCCTGGIYIIPSYEEHYDTSGNYLEYVLEAKSNEKWIVVKTIKENSEARYWLINKDFEVDDKYNDNPLPKEVGEELKRFIQSQITGPLNVSEFSEKTKELNISLTLE